MRVVGNGPSQHSAVLSRLGRFECGGTTDEKSGRGGVRYNGRCPARARAIATDVDMYV